jgi:RHS repeat-associated protein
MSGISSKAAGSLKNKENTFQNQRFDDDLGLNWVQFKWRNHDPQIGRFIEIDPLANDYVYNSTYAFSENRVINAVELEGLERADINEQRNSEKWLNGEQTEEKYRANIKAPAVGGALGGVIVFSLMFPSIAAPIIAADVFGVPSPTSPTSVVTTVVSETNTVANEVKTTASTATPELSPNVKKVVNTINDIKADGGTVKVNPLKPNQEVNMTVTKDGQKLDLRIETHPLSKKLGGDGTTPQRHMNVDTKPKIDLPNKGHKIISE